MVLPRRVLVGLVAALPAVLVSLRFFDVFLHPATGNNADWAQGAQFLVKLEFMLLFVAALTAWVAGRATVSGRVAAMCVVAAAFGAIVYGLWVWTGGSHVVIGVGLLIAGRFMAAAIAGPEATVEFTERAVIGVVFYFAVLLVIFEVTEILPRRYAIRLEYPAATFCAFYFLLLALVDAAQIYIRTPDAAPRRPAIRLGGTDAMTQASLALSFAGDMFEVAEHVRWRAAGRVVTFMLSLIPIGFAMAILLAERTSRRARLDPNILPEYGALILLALGGYMIYRSLRGGARETSLQVRRGGLAKLELFRGKLGSLVEVDAAEVRFDVLQAQGSAATLAVGRKGDELSYLMVIDEGLRDEAAARSLQRLFELYMWGDPSPKGLRTALEADPGLAALLGANVSDRLLNAPPLHLREEEIACPGCKAEIVATAVRCGYCGLLYPALD